VSPTGWTPRYTPEQMTRRLIRKVILGLVFGLALALFAAHNNGYGILIAPSEQIAAPADGLAMLRCTYFTGTEKVINHVARRKKEGDAKASCPFTARVGAAQLKGFTLPGTGSPPRDDLPGLGPNIQFDATPTPAQPNAAPAAPAPSTPPASPPAPLP
jgi:hypothetical protein